MSSNKRVKVEAYVEEDEFIDDNGKVVPFMRLVLPVADNTEKYIKVEKVFLQLAKDRAEKDSNPFKK